MQKNQKKPIRLLIHGGAGTLSKADLTLQQEQDYHAALGEALLSGRKILTESGSSLNAVEAAVRILEDSCLFNAGHGSVLTRTGTIELDAAIMDGKTLKAGSVAGVSHISNPISLAKIILEKSEHVMLIGHHAEIFASIMGMEQIDPQTLITEKQLKKWQELQNKPSDLQSEYEKHGTVGAVALDYQGNLAAGTSTGGIMNKTPGRVGDSPIIGAGTYADNDSCAVSATGQGEYFMRLLVAYDIAAKIKYKNLHLKNASSQAIKRLTQLGGSGGVIALDKQGNMAMPFNTEGMYRGYLDGENIITEIY